MIQVYYFECFTIAVEVFTSACAPLALECFNVVLYMTKTSLQSINRYRNCYWGGQKFYVKIHILNLYVGTKF